MAADLGLRLKLAHLNLLEAILGLSLETALQKALDCLPLGQRFILRARFGLNDGVERSPELIAKTLGANVQMIEELVQGALLALTKELEKQRPFHFLERLYETDEEFVERIRGTDLDEKLFLAACGAVLIERPSHSRARMQTLFQKKEIKRLSQLYDYLPEFEEAGEKVCRDIIAEARRQEAST